jgi:two-component system, chemotaxis family, CheB/CheR fusion protein
MGTSPSATYDAHHEFGPGRGASASTIVGIGASAGGLDALGEFLGFLPPDTGAAFVIVQHLSPAYPSTLHVLLARDTAMSVREVVDGAVLEADHVYVIPSHADVTIDGGFLRLWARHSNRGLHLPIDGLFRSIAADRGSGAIGVVLTGTGRDGTAGLSAIKEGGGATFAQDPASARFAGMPRSAIDAGVVDVVGTPDTLARSIAMVLQAMDPPIGEAG